MKIQKVHTVRELSHIVKESEAWIYTALAKNKWTLRTDQVLGRLITKKIKTYPLHSWIPLIQENLQETPFPGILLQAKREPDKLFTFIAKEARHRNIPYALLSKGVRTYIMDTITVLRRQGTIKALVFLYHILNIEPKYLKLY